MTKYYLWENIFVRCKIASHNVPRSCFVQGISGIGIPGILYQQLVNVIGVHRLFYPCN